MNVAMLLLETLQKEWGEKKKEEWRIKDFRKKGKKEKSNTLKKNEDWMMVDNRHNSLDSRFWGYVPEDHVVGKAMITFFSTDSTQDIFHKIRWNRIFKPID